LVGRPEREISFPSPNGNLGDHKKMYVKEYSGGFLWIGFKYPDRGQWHDLIRAMEVGNVLNSWQISADDERVPVYGIREDLTSVVESRSVDI
jgi:hypothetical protein